MSQFITTLFSNPDLPNNQPLPLSELQAYQLRQIDQQQVQATLRFSFTAPINVIDENAIINVYGATDNLLLSQNMRMKGCYDTESHYAYYINKALNETAPDELHPFFTYSNETILRQKRYIMGTTKPEYKYIIVSDLKLAYLLGLDYTQIGQKLYFVDGYLTFKKKMYILLHHEINVYCSQMLMPNYTGLTFQQEQAQNGTITRTTNVENQYLVVKNQYQFQPGSYCDVQGNYPMSFDVHKLIQGIQLEIKGEYGNNIDMEGSRFTVLLTCSPSEQIANQRQLQIVALQEAMAMRVQQQQIQQQQEAAYQAEVNAEKQSQQEMLNLRQEFDKNNELIKQNAEQTNIKIEEIKQGQQQLAQNAQELERLRVDNEQKTEQLKQALIGEDLRIQQLEDADELTATQQQELIQLRADQQLKEQEFNALMQEKEKLKGDFETLREEYWTNEELMNESQQTLQELKEGYIDDAKFITIINKRRADQNLKPLTEDTMGGYNKLLGLDKEHRRAQNAAQYQKAKREKQDYQNLVRDIQNGTIKVSNVIGMKLKPQAAAFVRDLINKRDQIDPNKIEDIGFRLMEFDTPDKSQAEFV